VTTTTANAKPSKSIADFTALCKKLTESKEDEKNDVGENTIESEKASHVYHPFNVKPAKEIVIPPVILPVKAFTHTPTVITSCNDLQELPYHSRLL
jgi:hypothetical protein